MPSRPLRVCGYPSCPNLVERGYCPAHKHLAPTRFADAARGTASSRGYGAAWKRIRDQVLREELLCRQCQKDGRATAATECDHIIPRAAGGTDARENLQALCTAHHRSKTSTEAAAIRNGGYRRR